MRILFASNDGISSQVFEVLCKNFDVVGVLGGKGRIDNELRIIAQKNNLPILVPEKLDKNARNEIRALEPDFLLSFSISRIFGPKFLSLFKKGTMNIHPSELPYLRGPSPIQFSILAGLKKSAISFQRISLGMDEGEIYHKVFFEISNSDNTETLRNKISSLAAESICDVLNNHIENPVPQKGEASYTRHIDKNDGKINFDKESAEEIIRKIKSYCIWPKCYCYFEDTLLFIEEAEALPECSLANIDIEKVVPGEILGFDKKTNSMWVKTIKGFLQVKKLRKDKRKTVTALDFLNGEKQLFAKQKNILK